MTDDTRNNGRTTAGRFAKGNPGRPLGARHKATLAAEAILDGEAEALTRKAVEKALEGDATALRLCLERIVPARKDRPITFELPQIDSVAESARHHGAPACVIRDGWGLGGVGGTVDYLHGGSFTTGALAGVALGHLARQGTLKIDQRIAHSVGRMLASSNPADYKTVLALAARASAGRMSSMQSRRAWWRLFFLRRSMNCARNGLLRAAVKLHPGSCPTRLPAPV